MVSPVLSVTHVAISVTDIDRSVAFYVGALGFALEHGHRVSGPFAVLAGAAPDAVIESRVVARDGMRIELVSYGCAIQDRALSRPAAGRGLVYLAVRVDDLTAVAEAVEAYGGQFFADSRIAFDQGSAYAYGCDPDGTLIELVRRGDDGSIPRDHVERLA